MTNACRFAGCCPHCFQYFHAPDAIDRRRCTICASCRQTLAKLFKKMLDPLKFFGCKSLELPACPWEGIPRKYCAHSYQMNCIPAALRHLNNFESLTKDQTCSLAVLPATFAKLPKKISNSKSCASANPERRNVADCDVMSQRPGYHRTNRLWFPLVEGLKLLVALLWKRTSGPKWYLVSLAPD